MIDVNSPESEKMKWYYDVLNPKVHKIVDKINNNKKLWYEVWIDLEENFDTMFGDYVFKYPNLAAYNIARWLVKQDDWYWSPTYVEQLEKAQEKYGDLCFNAVLNDRLNKK